MSQVINARDDLTVIKGIGPARQTWLRDQLEIQTYKDLAELSPEGAAQKLREAGQVISIEDIRGWIAEANKLVPAPAVQTPPEPPATASRPAGVDKVEWKTEAQFFVDFQRRRLADQSLAYRTKVHFMKDGREKIWSGLRGHEVGRWILDQMASDEREVTGQKPAVPVDQPALPERKTEEVDAETFGVTVEAIHLHQEGVDVAGDDILRAGRLFSRAIAGDLPFKPEISFILNGFDGVLKQRHAAGKVQVYAYDRQHGGRFHLGDSDPLPLRAGRRQYSASLPATSLPPGLYRLEAMVQIPEIPGALGFLELPLLRAV